MSRLLTGGARAALRGTECIPLRKGIELETHFDNRIWEAFFRRIDNLLGFPASKLELAKVWDPDTKKSGCISVSARGKEPEDKERLEKIEARYCSYL